MPGQLLVLTKSFLEEFIFSALLTAGRFSKCPMIGSRASHREISCPHYEWPLNSGGGGGWCQELQPHWNYFPRICFFHMESFGAEISRRKSDKK